MSASPESLASRVRAKYGSVYDDMDDATLESKVLAKHPQYADLASTQPAPAVSSTLNIRQVQSDLSSAYRQKFGKDIRVTSEGQDAYHQRHNLRHAGMIDVGLGQESEDERSFIAGWLRSNHVPHKIFTRAIPGTPISGPHAHIGSGHGEVDFKPYNAPTADSVGEPSVPTSPSTSDDHVFQGGEELVVPSQVAPGTTLKFKPKAGQTFNQVASMWKITPDELARLNSQDGPERSQGIWDQLPSSVAPILTNSDGTPRGDEFAPLSPEVRARQEEMRAQPNRIDDVNAAAVDLMGRRHEAQTGRRAPQPARKTASIPEAYRSPEAVTANVRWHFGIEPDYLQQLITNDPQKARAIIYAATRAAIADQRKKQADPNFKPVQDVAYQNEMRRRAGLPVRSTTVNAPQTDTSFGVDTRQITTPIGTQVTQQPEAMEGRAGANLGARTDQLGVGTRLKTHLQEQLNNPLGAAAPGEFLADTALDYIRHPSRERTPEELKQDEAERDAKLREQGEIDPVNRAIIRATEGYYGGVLQSAANLASLVPGQSARQFQHYLERRTQAMATAASAPPIDAEGNPVKQSFLEKLGQTLYGSGLTVAQFIALKKVSGANASTIMASEAAIQNLNKPAATRDAAVLKAAALGATLDRFGAKLGRAGSAAVFGGTGATEAALNPNASWEDVAVQGAGGAFVGAALGGRGIKGVAEDVARVGIRSERVPEPVKDFLARHAGIDPGLVVTDDGRFASAFVDPRTGEQIVQKITAEEAAKYDPSIVTGEARNVRNVVEIKGEEFDRFFGQRSALRIEAPKESEATSGSTEQGRARSDTNVESRRAAATPPTPEARGLSEITGRTAEARAPQVPPAEVAPLARPEGLERRVEQRRQDERKVWGRRSTDLPAAAVTRPEVPAPSEEVTPQPLGKIEPKQVIRHSDPNIDGGEVVGRAPDGRLKVQNNSGGISLVQDPRKQGNREAALVKSAEEPNTLPSITPEHLLSVLTQSDNPEARVRAAVQLGEIGKPENLPALRRATTVRARMTPEVRSATFEAIYRISQRGEKANAIRVGEEAPILREGRQTNQPHQRIGDEPGLVERGSGTQGLRESTEPEEGRAAEAQAQPVQSAASSDVTPKPLPPVEENYLKPLSHYTSQVYRETSLDRLESFLPTGSLSGAMGDEIHLANSPNFARGQGSNTGVMMEFDAAPIQGQVNRSKPAWEMAYKTGDAEFISKYTKEGDFQKALRRVNIRPDAVSSRVNKTRLRNALNRLVQEGWQKREEADGSITYERPDVLGTPATSIIRAEELRQEKPEMGALYRRKSNGTTWVVRKIGKSKVALSEQGSTAEPDFIVSHDELNSWFDKTAPVPSKEEAERQKKLEKVGKQKKPRRREQPDPKRHSAAVYAMLAGGIRPDKNDANIGELKRLSQKQLGNRWIGLVNRNSEYTAEQMASKLYHEGYLRDRPDLITDPEYGYVDPNGFLAYLEDDARSGGKHFSTQNEIHVELLDQLHDMSASEIEPVFTLTERIANFLEDTEVKAIVKRAEYGDKLSPEDVSNLRQIAKYQYELEGDDYEQTITEAIKRSREATSRSATQTSKTEPSGIAGGTQGGESLYAPEDEAGDALEPEGDVDTSFDFGDEETPRTKLEDFYKDSRAAKQSGFGFGTVEEGLFAEGGPTVETPKAEGRSELSPREQAAQDEIARKHRALEDQLGTDNVRKLEALEERPSVEALARKVLHDAVRVSRPALDDLIPAMQKLAALREADTPVADYINQPTLTGERELTPAQETLLSKLDKTGNLPAELWKGEASVSAPVKQSRFAIPRSTSEVAVEPEAAQGVTLQASVFGSGPFLEKDVLPTAKSFGIGVAQTLRSIIHLLAPTRGVPRDAMDKIMEMKGERDKSQYVLEQSMREIKQAFDRMPRAEQIAFMDKMKLGQKQPTPELKKLAAMYRVLDDVLFKEINKWKPDLEYRENHFRIMWKVIPGAPANARGGIKGLFRRPLQGTRGFMKQATLPDVSEGIARGGEPVSYNPQTLFELAYIDGMKYVTAQRMWNELKGMGYVVFVKPKINPPVGFTQVKDAIARIYFPHPSVGEWWVEENAARILNNHLSRDYIREAPLGQGLIWAKNQMTQFELGFSAFHAVFETIEAGSSQLGIGLREFVNLGVLKASPKKMLRGVVTMATAPASPATAARTGGSVIRYVTNPVDFVKSQRGASFIKRYPDAAAMVKDLFAGGAGKLGIHEGYYTNTRQTFRQAISDGNYPGALIRMLPALNEKVMSPLFETYIPRLKLGLFFREHQLALQENAKDLATGKLTRTELARKTWSFVEDRFGEMNFDNLFWDRTFKTAMQILFRSVTWKLGNLRASLGAIPEQGAEFVRAGRSRRLPKLSPKLAWLVGQALVTAALGTIIYKAFMGLWPETVTDVVYPRTDPNDPTQRIALPTYIKETVSLYHSPKDYAASSSSSLFVRGMEAWRNRDYFGTEIRSGDDEYWQQAWDVTRHFFPTPFSYAAMKRSLEEGQSPWRAGMGFLGFTKAPKWVGRSAAEGVLDTYYEEKGEEYTKTKGAAERAKLRRELARRTSKGENVEQEVAQYVEQGLLNPRQARIIEQATNMPLLAYKLKAVPLEVAISAYEQMTPEQREQVKEVFAQKIVNAQEITPAQEQRIVALGLHIPPPKPQRRVTDRMERRRAARAEKKADDAVKMVYEGADRPASRSRLAPRRP